jgi:hypothetical protein
MWGEDGVVLSASGTLEGGKVRKGERYNTCAGLFCQSPANQMLLPSASNAKEGLTGVKFKIDFSVAIVLVLLLAVLFT